MVWESVATTARLLWRRLGILLVGNILWLGMSLLIFTWPAATAGLFHLVNRIIEEELDFATSRARVGDFWEGFRHYGPRSSVLSVINLACFLLIFSALLLYLTQLSDPLRWLAGPVAVIGLAWLGAQIYLYALLLHRPDTGPVRVLREAFLIAISYPLYTGSLLITSLILASVAIALAGPILLIFFSAMALLQSISLRLIRIAHGELRPGAPPEDELRRWRSA